jgi:hypothetical protein
LTPLGAAGTKLRPYDSPANIGRGVGLSRKLLPDLETRPDLGHVAIEIKKRIDKIRQEIRTLQKKGDQNSKLPTTHSRRNIASTH